jgi:DNA-directed RNA polymerase specialized sigma subunit
VEQGRVEVATWSSLAKFAVSQVRCGRQVGSALNVKDVASKYCQNRKGVNLRSIHHWDDQEQQWQEILVEDKTATPAELAASRSDFPAWLKTLNERDRRIALKLSEGESTNRVARLFRISAARVSQLRRELLEAWNAFHGDLNLPIAEAAA